MIRSLLLPVFVMVLLSVAQLGFKLVGSRLTPFETLYSSGTAVLGCIAVAAYLLAIAGWFYVLSYMELSRASMFYGLTFFFVPLLAWACLGEQISMKQALGAATIVLGVALSTHS